MSEPVTQPGTAEITLRLPVADEAGSDPAGLLELARRAEDSGFHAVSLSDHVVMGPNVDRYPWGDFPFAPGAPWVEPLTMLSAIAAVTSRLRLTTGILIVPLRPAALLAKWAATLDAISGGRLELGVGTGWQEEEFQALGLDHSMRGRLLTDYVGACRALWSDSPAAFDSPTVSFSEIWCEPKPARRLPVLFSGTLTRRNRRRIVELGDGWIPIMGARRSEVKDGVDALRELYSSAGRSPADLRVRCAARIVNADAAATIESAGVLVEAGVTDVDIAFSQIARHPDDFEPFFAAAAKAIPAAGWVAGR